jgi:hypothetical protein
MLLLLLLLFFLLVADDISATAAIISALIFWRFVTVALLLYKSTRILYCKDCDVYLLHTTF